MINFKKNRSFNPTLKNFSEGFTLVELLVVLAIFTIMASITLFGYSDFKEKVSLENITQDIAISIKKAQVFAIGVKGVNVGGQNIFPAFGINFNLGNSQTFTLFADSNNNLIYDNLGGGGICNIADECLDEVTINTNDYISRFLIDGTWYDVSNYPQGNLNIIFKRPNLNALFCFYNSGQACTPSSLTASEIAIEVSSVNGRSQLIEVYSAGNINVK